MRKLNAGTPLNEVKGSINHTLHQIDLAFRKQFNTDDYYDRRYARIVETFADYVIVHDGELAEFEYWYVPYSKSGDTYAFTSRDKWEKVELTYTPATKAESASRQTRLNEVIFQPLQLVESTDSNKPRRVKAIGITADVVNANGRRYPASVLAEAVAELQTHLHESAGQGRMVLLGEAEHPSSKSGATNIAETVVKWDSVEFNGRQVLIEGEIIPTQRGKDILALIGAGVYPKISQRARGTSKTIKEGNRQIEEIESLRITGYDLVAEPSDPNAGITLVESQKVKLPMDLEDFRKQYPDLVRQIEEAQDEKARKRLEAELAAKANRDREIAEAVARETATVRGQLGLKDTDDLQKALDERNARLAALEEAEQARQVADYITKETAGLKYPAALKTAFDEGVKNAAPKTIDEAKSIIIAKRKEYDGIAAQMALALRGHGGVAVLGSVLENEASVPEFARASHEITESLVRSGEILRQDPNGESRSHYFARAVLKKFDEKSRQHLARESRELSEAELSTDLNLPYSVMRSIIAEVLPMLVAPNVFDFGTVDAPSTRMYFEAYSGETGVLPSVTNEVVTAQLAEWVNLANRRINPGSVVVTNEAGNTTYAEGTDYVIDYEGGRLYTLATITDGQTVHADYSYNAVRKGENAAIERAKVVMTYQTLEVVADRLATEISKETILFSRSQMGWDARANTINSLIKKVQRHIDMGIFRLALASALIVASNSGGTYDRSDDSDASAEDLARFIGVAKTKIVNRFYEPTSVVMSYSNADLMSNWVGFKRDGFPNALLNSAGFVGSVKGLPVFQTTQMPDEYILVTTRDMVMHRVYQPMSLLGPYPSYSSNKLLPMEQWYIEEFNGSIAPVPEKASYVKLQA